jgi:transcriptional regulator with XRE-family HTH domain
MTTADHSEIRSGEDPPVEHLTGVIERLRRERGYSLDRLAARSMIPRDELDRILAGEVEPDLSDIYLLAGALCVDPGLFFGGFRWTSPADGGSGYEITGVDSDD